MRKAPQPPKVLARKQSSRRVPLSQAYIFAAAIVSAQWNCFFLAFDLPKYRYSIVRLDLLEFSVFICHGSSNSGGKALWTQKWTLQSPSTEFPILPWDLGVEHRHLVSVPEVDLSGLCWLVLSIIFSFWRIFLPSRCCSRQL
jgi:hypothetical protein